MLTGDFEGQRANLSVSARHWYRVYDFGTLIQRLIIPGPPRRDNSWRDGGLPGLPVPRTSAPHRLLPPRPRVPQTPGHPSPPTRGDRRPCLAGRLSLHSRFSEIGCNFYNNITLARN